MELQSIVPELLDVVVPVWLVGMPALLVAAVVIAMLLPKHSQKSISHLRPLLMISGGIALGSLAIFLIFGIVGPYSLAANPRYQVAFTVPLSLFLATVARRLTAHLRHHAVSAALVAAVSIAATWIAFGNSPLVPVRIAAATGTAAEWKQASQLISGQSQQHDLVLVQSGLVEAYLVPTLFDDQLFMEYVACRIGKVYVPEVRRRLAIPFFWKGATEMTEFFRREFSDVQKNGGSIWIAAATETDIMQMSLTDTQNLLSKCGWECVHSDSKSAMTLERYQIQSPGASISTSSGSLNENVPYD